MDVRLEYLIINLKFRNDIYLRLKEQNPSLHMFVNTRLGWNLEILVDCKNFKNMLAIKLLI